MEKLIVGAAKLGINLAPAQIRQFETFYHLLADWNQRINLTSVINYDEVQVKHFLDSLTVVLAVKGALEDGGSGIDMIDVGAGAGLPGIPLKLVLPHSRLVLLDSVGKKTSFLRELVHRLALERVEVVTARAEDAARQTSYRETFNLVLARALARLPVAAELTLPFCRPVGITVHQKKGDIAGELKEAETAVKILGGQLRDVLTVGLDELSDDRCLVVIEKVKSTPLKYPRRAGMPQKRPIGQV